MGLSASVVTRRRVSAAPGRSAAGRRARSGVPERVPCVRRFPVSRWPGVGDAASRRSTTVPTSSVGYDVGRIALHADPRATGRDGPSGTDLLDETDTTIPHANDAGGAGAPAAPAASCCDQAFAAGLARTDYGGVICCNNVKHSCVWPSNLSSALTNGQARAIAIRCARIHEDTHHDDIDCTGAALERPAYKAGKDAKAEECTAYRAESTCLTNSLPQCGGDATCTSQITSRRDTKNSQAAGYCS